jgi:hypothetical protein
MHPIVKIRVFHLLFLPQTPFIIFAFGEHSIKKQTLRLQYSNITANFLTSIFGKKSGILLSFKLIEETNVIFWFYLDIGSISIEKTGISARTNLEVSNGICKLLI